MCRSDMWRGLLRAWIVVWSVEKREPPMRFANQTRANCHTVAIGQSRAAG